MKYLPIIIILAVVTAIWCVIVYLRNKIRETSRALFDTSDISQAAKQMKQEYATTPMIEINIHAWSFSNIDEIRS